MVPIGIGAAVFPFRISTPSSAVAPKPSSPPTFNQNIAPIIFQHCSSCHRPHTAAPFSLLNYKDVAQRGAFIASVVRKKYMPPWKLVSCSVQFRNQNILSSSQIDEIQEWVKDGMPKGKGLPPQAPHFDGNWNLGQPDLIVKMPRAFTIPASGPDIYRNFVVPLHLSKGTYIKAIEFHPSARRVVHHSLFYYDATGYAQKLDGQDGQPGFSGLMAIRKIAMHSSGHARAIQSIASFGGSGTAANHSEFGSLGGWAVGANAVMLPHGLAYYVPKSSVLILSTHFHPDGRVEHEQSVIGLYFAKSPPRQAFTTILLPPVFGAVSGIDIPAGDKDYEIHDSFKLPVAIKAFGVTAHAHYLGKKMLLTATLPSGKVLTLLNIPNWDFNWQGQYQYQQAVNLPAGTVLHSLITYDNSASNPHQPNNPPKEVWWGEQTTDEMGSLILLVYPDQPSQMKSLNLATLWHLRADYLANRGHLHGLGASH